MRRIIAVVLCCMILTLPVYADNAASDVAVTGTVTPNGSCQIAINLAIRLDQPVNNLSFPLGSDVSAVSLNGANASLTQSEGITSINLDSLNGLTGTFPIAIHYTVNSVIKTDDHGKQFVSIPLLTGFKYPVEKMSFSVTMPSIFDTVPVFLSGYHKQDIERDITTDINGAIISGSVNVPLKDSETLVLNLQTPEGMFPKNQALGGNLLFANIAMGVCAAAALLYWIITMRCRPLLPIHRSTAPDGISAGNVGSYLAHKRADLTMMVIHWAQLGYLMIHLDQHGRVFLYKRMEMGNERNAFEQRIFKNLFGKATMIDATSYRYTRQCEKTALISKRYSAGYLAHNGNPNLFRLLSCLVGLFAGIIMGGSIVSMAAWQILSIIFMAGICTVCSWFIQEGMSCLFLYQKNSLQPSILCAVIVLLAGVFTHCAVYAIIVVCWNLFVGLAAAYGGKRSENGARIYQEILGLRRHMKKVSKTELVRIMRTNPDYYYELVPFALALGVDKQLARQFDALPIPDCTWLLTGIGPARTAGEFCTILRETVKSMTAEQHRSLVDKILRIK